MSNVLPIVLTFDLDPDIFDELIASTKNRTKLSWLGISEGVARIGERLAAITDDFGNQASCTWFVLVDNKIGATYGRPGYLLENYSSVFRSAVGVGHEIAWHPHLYRQVDGGWQQETDDGVLEGIMDDSLTDMRRLGYRPICSRIGEAYGSVGIMRTLDRLGIKFDATAMAGRKRVDDERMIDWLATPEHAYHPSCADHRIPGTPHFSVLEIPMSMLNVRAAYDKEPLRRYLDLSFHPQCLAEGLPTLIAHAPYLMTVTHPSALLPECRPIKSHGLLSYDLECLGKNLSAVLDEARRQGRQTKFMTLAQMGLCMPDMIDAQRRTA